MFASVRRVLGSSPDRESEEVGYRKEFLPASVCLQRLPVYMCVWMLLHTVRDETKAVSLSAPIVWAHVVESPFPCPCECDCLATALILCPMDAPIHSLGPGAMIKKMSIAVLHLLFLHAADGLPLSPSPLLWDSIMLTSADSAKCPGLMFSATSMPLALGKPLG